MSCVYGSWQASFRSRSAITNCAVAIVAPASWSAAELRHFSIAPAPDRSDPARVGISPIHWAEGKAPPRQPRRRTPKPGGNPVHGEPSFAFCACIGTMNRQRKGARTALSASPGSSVRADMAVRAPGNGSWKASSGSLIVPAIISELFAAGTERLSPLAPKLPHFPAKARRIIFLYMTGGASHVDSFDYKP